MINYRIFNLKKIKPSERESESDIQHGFLYKILVDCMLISIVKIYHSNCNIINAIKTFGFNSRGTEMLF